MLKNLLIISIASTFFMACKSNKETAASAEKTTTEQVKTSETKDQAAASATTPEAVIPETKIKADSVKEDPDTEAQQSRDPKCLAARQESRWRLLTGLANSVAPRQC